MAIDGGPGRGDQMMRRARNVALGFAETGLTQAEEMLRRVSPEGRAQARREREARTRRRNRLLARLAIAALASLAVFMLSVPFVGSGVAILAAALTMTLLTALILARAAPRSPGRESLAGAKLVALPEAATTWLAAHRRGLPAPAAQLSDALIRRLDDMTPQLVPLDPREPAADAVRKLIAVELPALVEGWRAVPPSLRAAPHADGQTPDGQLIAGLTLINEEVDRMTEQLARGALDEVATQGRYLELKYRGGM